MRPVLLMPVYKDYLWGGEKLKTDYNKETSVTPLAESWELSCHKDGTSRLINEPYETLTDYISANPEALGTRGAGYSYFPILFKLIDARDDLSLQVHPNDEYAQRVEGEYGKTEQWIVLECEPNARLVLGFKEGISKDEMRRRIADNTILDVVNFVPVKRGDVFFIAAGTMHAIGKGMVIAEIQQNSNTTYRVYDYARVGADGKQRPLHIEKAIEVTDTNAYKKTEQNSAVCKLGDCTRETLADCEYFKTERLTLEGSCTLCADETSFVGLFCADGVVSVKSGGDTLKLQKGQTAFLPAGLGEYTLSGTAQLISMGV